MKEVEKKEVPDVSGGLSYPDDSGYPPFPDPDYPYPGPYPRNSLPMTDISGGQGYGSCIPLPDIIDGPTVFDDPITNPTNSNL